MADEFAEEVNGNDLLEGLASLARELADSGSLDETLQRVVDRAEEYLDACDGVSMMLIRSGRFISSPAYSSRVAYDSDLAQYSTGEGPCLGAIAEHKTIVIDDLEQEQRWPRYRERALQLGVRSMLSLQLFVSGETLGALDMYSKKPHAFDRRSVALGQVFASHASVAMKAAIEAAGLEQALESRDLIGQAKGIIMEGEQVTAGQALERLRELSTAREASIRKVAQQVVETGDVSH